MAAVHIADRRGEGVQYQGAIVAGQRLEEGDEIGLEQCHVA